MSDEEELRRKSDIQVAILQQEFRDFRLSYEKDIAKAIVDRDEMMKIIKGHDEFIRDIKPIYAKGMMALGAAILGSIGIGVHWLWNHIKWGP